MAEAVVGKYFNSYESVKCFVKDYELSKCVQLSVKSSLRIKPCKPSVLQLKMGNVNMDLVYSMIEYKCVHGGEYRSHGNGKRKTKTLKQGCPFVMKINLSADAQKLRISRLEEHHNHEISKEKFISLPKQRLSLDESQRASIQEMLALKCNKKLVKQHIATVMGKNVTSRDIHNMKPKDLNSLKETVKYLKSLGGYVEVVADKGKLEGIFYQDSRMRNAFSANPDLLLLDATFCYNLMPLYILMVINGNGQGQVAALFILAHKTSSNITKMLSIFRQKNTSSEATKIIFTDKDFSEREAIRQTFPGTNLLLCFFHTLKTFRSKVAKMGLPNDDKKKALHTLQKIACSKNEIEYEEHHAQLLNLKNPHLTEYFETNWHPRRYEWVRGFIKMEKTFSITTTNHLDSLNNKIKQVVARNSNLLSFFKDLLSVLDSSHGEQKSRAYNLVIKRSTQYDEGSTNEEPPTCTDTSLPAPKKNRIMNKQDKYKKSMEVIGDIANILSDYGIEKFSSTLEKLKSFKNMLIENPDKAEQILEQETGVEEEGIVEMEEMVNEEVGIVKVKDMVNKEVGIVKVKDMVSKEAGIVKVKNMVSKEAGIVKVKDMVSKEAGIVKVKDMVNKEVGRVKVKDMVNKEVGRVKVKDMKVVGIVKMKDMKVVGIVKVKEMVNKEVGIVKVKDMFNKGEGLVKVEDMVNKEVGLVKVKDMVNKEVGLVKVKDMLNKEVGIVKVKDMLNKEVGIVKVKDMLNKEVVKVKDIAEVEQETLILEEQQEVEPARDLKNISVKGTTLKRRGRPGGADTTVVPLKKRRLKGRGKY